MLLMLPVVYKIVIIFNACPRIAVLITLSDSRGSVNDTFVKYELVSCGFPLMYRPMYFTTRALGNKDFNLYYYFELLFNWKLNLGNKIYL